MSPTRPRVLFVCTHNSARSQMAEGLLRSRFGDRLDAASAGTEPRGVHPQAVAAMAELGIDLSGHRSKSVEEALEGGPADVVVTVCDSARESCPWVPARLASLHQSFPDPSAVASEDQPAAFRRVRDAISTWLEQTAPTWWT